MVAGLDPAEAPTPVLSALALAIVAYEQPVTRADISRVRGVDSTGVIDSMIGRGLIADDARLGGRARPSFLVTTAQFLRYLGIGSLAELPPRPPRQPATEGIAEVGVSGGDAKADPTEASPGARAWVSSMSHE